MASSTFAWFSMNDIVSLEGMSVTAKGAIGLFFQIVAGEDEFDPEIPMCVAVSKNTEKKLYPTKVGSEVLSDEVKKLTGSENTSDLSLLKWAVASSNNPDASERFGDFTSVTSIANHQDSFDEDGNLVKSNINCYTLINKFRVRTNPAVISPDLAKDLTVSKVKIQASATNEEAKSMLTAVRVLFVSRGGTAVFDYGGTVVEGRETDIGNPRSLIADGDIPNDEQGIDVFVYIYFDGDDERVFSHNASTNGYSVSFELNITSPNSLA